jgi:hypothetical protein
MHDERVPGRPLLGGEDPGNGFGGASVGAQAVDGLRGKSDEASGAEEIGGASKVGWIGSIEMEGFGHALALPS